MVCIVDKFMETYNSLLKVGIIKPEFVIRSDSASKWSFHSILQYVLIKAGVECGYISIPEYKVRLNKPIDKFSLDKRFTQRKSRYQWNIKVDVAFFKDLNLIGVGEIYTLDEVHGCLPSKMLSGPWITPYHKLHNLLENCKLRFLVVVNVLPQAPIKLSPWRDVRMIPYDKWGWKWRSMTNKLQRRKEGVKVYHIEINEDFGKP